jgi:hypothetical protein
MATTSSTVVGVFNSPQEAQKAVMELKTAGIRDDEIGVLSRNDEGRIVGKEAAIGTANAEGAAVGAAAGVATGAGIGALWGLGIVAGVLPGIGPAIAGGTLGILLSSAAAGGAAAGITGALVGLGVSQDEASFYENEFKPGRTLVTVKGGTKSASVHGIIERQGGCVRQPQAAGA